MRPETVSMTCPELAQFLNALGVTSKNGRDHNWPVLWDIKTLRRKLGRARETIVVKPMPMAAVLLRT
jgi:hypothetical protein